MRCRHSFLPFPSAVASDTYSIPDTVPQPILAEPFDGLDTGSMTGFPKKFKYNGTVTEIAGKVDGAVTLEDQGHVFRGGTLCHCLRPCRAFSP